MKTFSERGYWIVVAFIMFLTLSNAALVLWVAFGESVGHPLWRKVIDVPASWLLPTALRNGVMFLMVPIPELTWRIFVASLTALTLTPIALAGWFYGSRHKSLHLRGVVLAGLVAVGVILNLFVDLMWRLT